MIRRKWTSFRRKEAVRDYCSGSRWIAIDPGKHGAAVVMEGKELLRWVLLRDGEGYGALGEECREASWVVVEQPFVGSRNPSSALQLAVEIGIMYGVARPRRVVEVHPTTWQSAVLPGSPRTRQALIERMLTKVPVHLSDWQEASWMALPEADREGVASAVMIARWAIGVVEMSHGE